MPDSPKEKAPAWLTNVTAAFVAVASSATAIASFSLVETGNRAIRMKSIAIDRKTTAVQHWTDSHSIETQISIARLEQRMAGQAVAAGGKIKKLQTRQKKSVANARRLEVEADVFDDRSEALLRPRLWQILGLILLQVSVALGSITILIKSRAMLGLAGFAGLGGVLAAISGALLA
jgi:hypothetical protein